MIRICLGMLVLLLLSGCQSSSAVPQKYSAEFTKSAKYTWSLLKQASVGQPVREADLSVAFANLESLSHNTDEESVKLTLQTYRLELEELKLKISKKEQKDALAKVKQENCELDETLNKGIGGYQAAKDCGENLP